MNENKKKVTTVSPIDWKESFSCHPLIIVNALEPIKYRIACYKLSNDGECLTILPSLNGTIDDMLKVLEGCLMEESNFCTMLEEYYGKEIRKLTQINCNFNDIEVTITKKMSAEEAKIQWLRDGLNAGHKNLVIYMTSHEKAELECDPAMSEIIRRYRAEL